jgi:putative flavoprotein involved in K+ transport
MADVVIIGAGQAGRAAGQRARAAGLDCTILEAAGQAGGSWPCYYDSLELFSPARYSALPGKAFPGDPERYPRRDEVVAYLRDYARTFDLPVTTGFRVASVRAEPSGRGFVTAADDGRQVDSKAVVVASGGFGAPRLPNIEGQALFAGERLHSRDYRRPGPFAGRRVVVVGAGNSAVQIAVELAKVAQVTLASRAPVRFAPQRLLGQDIHFWLKWTGLDHVSLPGDPTAPVVDDGRYSRALRRKRPERRPMFTRFTSTGVVWPDGAEEPVDVVIFATGFGPSLDFLADGGALDAQGRPLQRHGASTSLPGLFYVGLPWQEDLSSATIRGAARDSRPVVAQLARTLAARTIGA